MSTSAGVAIETSLRVPPTLATAIYQLAQDYAERFEEPPDIALQLVLVAVIQRGLKSVREDLDR